MNTRGLALGWIVISTALAVACSSDSDSDSGKKNTGGSGGNTGGSGGGNTGGSNTGGSNTGGSNTGGSSGSSTGGTAGSSTGGNAGSSTGGTAGSSTGGNAGSSAGGTAGSSSGGSGGKPDAGLKSCAQLASEYATALEAAKACNPVLSVLQCTKQVNDELPCPCPTFVNPANAKAAAELDDLQAAWNAQNCGSGVICPAVLCQAPGNGVCQAASGSLSGKCANSVPN